MVVAYALYLLTKLGAPTGPRQDNGALSINGWWTGFARLDEFESVGDGPLIRCIGARCAFAYLRIESPTLKLSLVSKDSPEHDAVRIENSEGLKIGGSGEKMFTSIEVVAEGSASSSCTQFRAEHLVVQELQVDDDLLHLFGHFWIDYVPSFFPLLLTAELKPVGNTVIWYRSWAQAAWAPTGFGATWLRVLGYSPTLPGAAGSSTQTLCFRSFGIGNDRRFSISRVQLQPSVIDPRMLVWRKLSHYLRSSSSHAVPPARSSYSTAQAWDGAPVQVTLFLRSVRLGSSKRRLVNESELVSAAMLTSPTLIVFRPEQLTSVDIVRVLGSTDIFIAAHGSGQANMLFLRPASHIVELQPPRFWEVNHEWMMKRASELLGLHFFAWQSALHVDYSDEQVRKELDPDIFVPRNYIFQRRYFLDNDIYFDPMRFQVLLTEQVVTYRLQKAHGTLPEFD
jgi:hypothetical protein